MGLTEWPSGGAAVLSGVTHHARLDGPSNAFAYDIDYVLLRQAPRAARPPTPFGLGRFGPVSFSNRDHGFGAAKAVDWAIDTARASGLPDPAMAEVWLLTQPRRFGYVFNPVSFWFFRDQAGAVRAALAEVNNTYGDRHAYFCSRPGFAPLTGGADAGPIVHAKAMHVSPFQDVTGDYVFTFTFPEDRIAISIKHRRAEGGMTASLAGRVQPLNRAQAFRLAIRWPFGAFRVIGLIHWQAFRLARKGVRFRRRPAPPAQKVSG